MLLTDKSKRWTRNASLLLQCNKPAHSSFMAFLVFQVAFKNIWHYKDVLNVSQFLILYSFVVYIMILHDVWGVLCREVTWPDMQSRAPFWQGGIKEDQLGSYGSSPGTKMWWRLPHWGQSEWRKIIYFRVNDNWLNCT